MTAKTRFPMIPPPLDFTKPVGREYLRELGRRANQTFFWRQGGTNVGAGATKVAEFDYASALKFGGEAVNLSLMGATFPNANNKTIQIRLGGVSYLSVGPYAMNGASWRIQGQVIRGSDREFPFWAFNFGFDCNTPAVAPSQGVGSTVLLDYDPPQLLEVYLTGGISGDVELLYWRGSLSHAP